MYNLSICIDHEWSKHGTCSSLTQPTYFGDSLNLIKKIGTPASVTANVGGTLSAATLRNDMGGAQYVSLQCVSGQYLSGAFICLSQSNGVPGGKQICPADVQKEDTCTKATLIIQSF